MISLAIADRARSVAGIQVSLKVPCLFALVLLRHRDRVVSRRVWNNVAIAFSPQIGKIS